MILELLESRIADLCPNQGHSWVNGPLMACSELGIRGLSDFFNFLPLDVRCFTSEPNRH